MAKRFFYVAAGLFLLAAAYHLGAERARADWTPGGLIVGTDGFRVWDSNGACWVPAPGTWLREDLRHLPPDVPVGSVKLFGGDGGGTILVTSDDEVWRGNGGDGWTRMSPYPGGPVSVPSQSFGRTKAAFR